MNLNDSILTQGADAPFSPGTSDHPEFWEIIGERFVAEKLLALSWLADHSREAIFKEGDLLKIVHRFHELSPVSPQIYQQLFTRIVAFLFGIRG